MNEWRIESKQHDEEREREPNKREWHSHTNWTPAKAHVIQNNHSWNKHSFIDLKCWRRFERTNDCLFVWLIRFLSFSATRSISFVAWNRFPFTLLLMLHILYACSRWEMLCQSVYRMCSDLKNERLLCFFDLTEMSHFLITSKKLWNVLLI